jgi:Na+/H+ antiporter NhaD/arsenite permease-like protein
MQMHFGNPDKTKRWALLLFLTLTLIFLPLMTMAGHGEPISFWGIRIEFILFALILVGVAVFHNYTFWVALIGLSVVLGYKLIFDVNFHAFEHFLGSNGVIDQFISKDATGSWMRQGEWPILLNLFGLLLGFAVLAKVFEESGLPEVVPDFLPGNWMGPFTLLVIVFVMSSFLDNIAAALIGGTIAMVVFKKKVHIGYIAAIVAASNAGGSGSVLGDTTTTMMWIDGVSPLNVLHAFLAAIVAILITGWFGSHQQHKYQPIQLEKNKRAKINWRKLMVVFLILGGAILSNFFYDMPALGVWVALLIGWTFTRIPWKEVAGAVKGTVFLLCLVTCASLMPVETLPDASWLTAFILGFVSAVFDNIPLTKLCLEQGHYDWGMLAYTVGFGGSMIWFGSSAGVAITNKFPESRDVVLWLRKGWHVILAYVVGFFVLLLVMNWEPADNKEHKEPAASCPVENCKAKKDAIQEMNGAPEVPPSH